MSEAALPLMLKELRLPTFARHHQNLQQKAVEQAWSYSRFLSALCEQEIATRYQSRVTQWTKAAKLPKGKSFSTLVIEDLPDAVQKQVIALRDHFDWARQADNVLLIGPSGVGKSHIAAALGGRLIEQGIRVKWLPAVALVQMLQRAKQELDLMSTLARLDRFRVLIIDDIGYVKKSDCETQVLFEFIAHRYESGSLIITSNQPFSHWDEIFPDTMMAVAAIDRIIHHATIIEIDKASYRRKKEDKT